jgi:hypothetical protein
VGMRKWEFGSGKWEFGSGNLEVGSGKSEVGMRKWECGMRKWDPASFCCLQNYAAAIDDGEVGRLKDRRCEGEKLGRWENKKKD